MIVYFILKDYNKNLLVIKIDIYLVYDLSKIWPTIFYYVDLLFSRSSEIVKDSKNLFM